MIGLIILWQAEKISHLLQLHQEEQKIPTQENGNTNESLGNKNILPKDSFSSELTVYYVLCILFED
jgi:hypothetical protein